MVAHSVENVGRGFGSQHQRAHDRRRNLTKNAADGAGDAFLLVTFGGAVNDVRRLLFDAGVEDLKSE